jgi:3-methylfumaryl-CoA hydratase
MTATIERTELLVPGPAIALSRLLDVPAPDIDAGEGLPLTWHWVYLLERPATASLGRDGHPVHDAIPAPPGPGRRRMWAGGRIQSLGPLRVGELARRRTAVTSTTEKEGRTGRLTFVTVGHQISQGGQVVVAERQDIVYRDEVQSPATEPQSPGPEVPPTEDEWRIEITPTLLFRFSALTYNGHRIHYDRDYSRGVEGYPGLVTHGPLQAVAMAEAARARGLQDAPGATLEYRLVSPLYDHQGLIARADADGTTSVRDLWGRRTAVGSVGTSPAPRDSLSRT